MALKWYRTGDGIFAVGKQARYTIIDNKLTAIGFDGLPLLSLPPYGEVFSSLVDAAYVAERLDSREYIEMQMGGE